MNKHPILAVLFGVIAAAAQAAENPKSHYIAPLAAPAPVIDGVGDEAVWQKAPWKAMDQVLIGEDLKPEDLSGRIKIAWDRHYVYLLAEIVDDVLSDVYADPLSHYWDDDCLEIFIDEDASGGDHQYNHNAFAYHIALDNQVVDSGPDKSPHLYNNHIISQWRRSPEGVTTWEVAISVYDDTYVDGDTNAKPVTLKKGKQLGFMVAYCDNDGGKGREHFLGTENIAPVNGDRNRGWIDASVFGLLELGD